MAELSKQMALLGFSNVRTLLNSGNLLFDVPNTSSEALEQHLGESLRTQFGFPIPVLVRTSEEFLDLLQLKPFEHIKMHKNLRLYVSFLKQQPVSKPVLPLSSADSSYTILAVEQKAVFSVLDLTASKTVTAMADLEHKFGKEITTRNWNTVLRICSLLQPK
jgi:uncharacterized protein (DUF1697 family)